MVLLGGVARPLLGRAPCGGVLRLRGGGWGATEAVSAASEVGEILNLTERLEEFFEHGIAVINVFGGVLLLLAVTISLLNVMLFFINRIGGTKFPLLVSYTDGSKKTPVQLTRVRFQLGSMISLALMVMVAADVLETLVKPADKLTLTCIYKLGLIAVIRTGLAYFLGKEMKEIEEELEEHDGIKSTV